MGEFDNLSTEEFRLTMRPHAVEIYQRMFGPDCTLRPLKKQADGRAHILDQCFGIDGKLALPQGNSLYLQEKYREPEYLTTACLQVEPPWPDFTQEYMNAVGTDNERQGEWFHLAAQVYFYGWAKPELDGFAAWVLLDVPRYKLIVQDAGGLDAIGKLQKNDRHGKASFYCIPVYRLRRAWIYSHNLVN